MSITCLYYVCLQGCSFLQQCVVLEYLHLYVVHFREYKAVDQVVELYLEIWLGPKHNLQSLLLQQKETTLILSSLT